MTNHEHDLTLGRVDGERTAFVLPTIPDGASDVVREGLARRRLVAITGACPCGARLLIPNRRQRRAAAREGRVLPVAVEHEHDCPAIADELFR